MHHSIFFNVFNKPSVAEAEMLILTDAQFKNNKERRITPSLAWVDSSDVTPVGIWHFSLGDGNETTVTSFVIEIKSFSFGGA